MATLIPYFISNEASAAERKIFNIIKNDDRMKDWIVFHSLKIEKHIKHFQGGEADFVIIAPNLGCFVIEVKGGEHILIEDGVWKSISFNGEINKIKNPFNQASENRYSIHNYLDERGVSHPFFEKGVAFPDTIFSNTSIEYDKDEIFDASYNNDFFKYIRKLSNYYNAKGSIQGRRTAFRAPTANEIKDIRLTLAPRYESVTPLSIKIDNNQNRIIQLTENQYKVLDELQYADSAIIHGPAGTGKTLLAVEMAKRKASRNNVKIALVTYNLLLTEYLKCQVRDFDNITVFSISDFFEQKCNEYGLIKEEDKENRDHYYQNIIPKLALEILSVESIQFDTIIVDEAQDFTASYLIVLSQMLKGHVAKGNYYFFGDFIYHGIFDTRVSQKEVRCYIEAMGGMPIDKELIVNVRNSYLVQKELDTIAKTSTKSAHPEVSEELDIYRLYEDENDELEQIEKTLNILICQEKVKPENITILSRKSFCNSIASRITKHKISLYTIPKEDNIITFCSIRKFKGLENDVILVVDNDHYTWGNKDLHILYVAISRAKQKVIVYESLEAQIERESIMRGE